MKKLIFSVLSVLTIATTGCKKDKDTPSDADPLYNAFQTLLAVEEEFIRIGETQDISPVEALAEVVGFAESQQGVETVFLLDGRQLNITTTDGFSTSLSIDEVDENGLSIFRGGPNGTRGLMEFDGDCSHQISNKKVLLFAAAHDDFYSGSEYQNRVANPIINNGEVDTEVTVLKNAQCTPEVMQTFNQYGLVILDTHGQFDAVLTGIRFTMIEAEIPGSVDAFHDMLDFKIGSHYLTLLLAKDLGLGKKYKYDPDLQHQQIWQNYKQGLDGHYALWMTSKGIRDLIPDLNETVVFANCCYSGFRATNYAPFNMTFDPIQPAWMSKNPIAYYGYEATNNQVSYEAYDWFCKKNADSLIHSFFYDGDSTGLAHLFSGSSISTQPWDPFIGWSVNEGPLKFNVYNNLDWCYGNCGGNLTDPRDQQVYQTVCIGNQTWMAENLNYETGNSWCYDNDLAMCDSLGRLYDWQSAMSACPPGWHLPTEAELLELVDSLGGYAVAGGELKSLTGWNEPNVGATNGSEFSALGAGRYLLNNSNFADIGDVTAFWSSSQAQSNPDLVTQLQLSRTNSTALTPQASISIAASSCRCVKD